MKNIVKFMLVAALCCLSLSESYAQRYYYNDRESSVASYLDFHLGEGIGHGAKGFGGANISFLYRFSPEFQFGIGGGIDYFHALAIQGGEKKTKDFDYHGELSLPLFMRGRYAIGGGDFYNRGAQFFVQFDLGYRVGLSAYNTGKENGIKNLYKNFEKTNVKGLFFEPQIGIAASRSISFSLGFPIQRYTKNTSPISVVTITEETPIKSKNLMFMGADLHFMVCF